MNEDEYELEEQEKAIDRFNIDLPKVVLAFQEAATKYSYHNEIPATISFYNILGSISKDFVSIGDGFGRLDTRVHFLWIQTSGTGKSTLWNFVGPVSRRVYDMINKKGSHPMFSNPTYDETRAGEEFYIDSNPPYLERRFDIFGITDYTDAALIGNLKIKEETVINEDDNTRERVPVMTRLVGSLEGDGIAHWDEFEYSGIFKKSQHNEKSVVYLNTLMNTLHGENWIIKKSLDAYEGLDHSCFSQRSVLAMTYPPSNLADVMVRTGVLQRFLIYVKNVPEQLQDEIRRTKIRNSGSFQTVEQPIDRFADAIFKIYELLDERYREVDGQTDRVITFSPEYNDTFMLEYERLMKYIDGTRPEVRTIVSTFLNRMNDSIIRMAVLSCIASAPSITDKSKRFIVTGKNVQQAAKIVKQCYASLVDWIDESIKVKKKSSLAETSLKINFFNAFKELKEVSTNGKVGKGALFRLVGERVGKSNMQVSRDWHKVSEYFNEEKNGRQKFVDIKEGVEE